MSFRSEADEPLEKIRALVGALVPGNRFYTERLRVAGVTAANIASLEDYAARVPLTTKEELVADQWGNPPYGSNFTAPLRDYSRFCQTSGTSGAPLVVLDTAENWLWMLGNWRRIYKAAGVAAGDRVYFAFSFGPFLGFWTAFEAASALGCLCIPGGAQGSEARLGMILKHEVEVLLCTPTYALHLAEVAHASGVDLSRSAVRKIIVAGEPGGSVPEVRARLSAAWNGARVFDHYGMTEVGPVAFEDASRPCVQTVLPESYWPEVIDPQSGLAAEPGAVGELVLTPLGRHDTPLLRYRTGDLVRAVHGSRGLELHGGILGRADDMVVVRGVNLYPGAVDAVVRTVPAITEYRVHLERRGVLAEVSIEAESTAAGAAVELERALAAAFSLRIPVTQVAAGSLPRFELKARRWVVQPTQS